MGVKIFLKVALTLGFLSCVQGLKCMTCENAESFDECDSSGHIQDCMPNQASCQTVVRGNNDHMRVLKGCKSERACKDNQLQNSRHSGKSLQCNSDQANYFCTCCCDSDMCNVGISKCTTHYLSQLPVKDCPSLPANIPHGKIECYNENTSGSVCQYKCTGKDYSVWPPNRAHNVCLGNGTWAYEQPCCARPCPPYYLLDDVYMFNFGSSEDSEAMLRIVMERSVLFPKIADDAIKISSMYYSGQPIESSVIKFNEYGTNATRLMELHNERISVVSEGPVNTGAAMQYALDNLFTVEAGMRDERVPKAMFLYFYKANPEDNVRAALEEARRRGIQVYVFGYEAEGFELDRQKLIEVTGEEAHVFVFASIDDSLGPEAAAEVNKHFCQKPCDHVLHDHE